jgi:WD40 repeat protein
VKAQPGFSGSPVWNHATGAAVGLLKAAPFPDEGERDAYLVLPRTVAQAWEAQFDYLLVPENPFRGLEPFKAEHAGLFFGRDADIAALTARVLSQPVVIIVGPSGVGKSSLVQAGLIPALRQHHQWSVALIRPGQDPWHRLAVGLLHIQHGADAVVTLDESVHEIDRLRREGLHSVARFLRSEDRPLLVVVDQFEELLAGGERPDPALLDLLLPPAGEAEYAARLVVTLRADFLRALQSIPGLHTRLNDRLYLLSPLTAEQRREAVVRPALARGVNFEPRLAEQIVRDAAVGALPVLQFALTKLWTGQRRKTLTFTGYHAMGGVHGALDRFAEDSAAGLGDSAAVALDRVLLRLVRASARGTDPTARQRVSQSQVPTAEWEVLQRLADARLVVLDVNPDDGEPYAELAHESLITAWKRLRDLVLENAEFLEWLAWIQQRAADADPLPEARIAEARRWLDSRRDDIPGAICEFIDSSETAAEMRLHELRDARDRAEAARMQADAAARRTEALRLAANAELALRTARPPTIVALALSMESLLTEPTVQGDIALRRVLRLHPATLARLEHDDAVYAVVFSPDGTQVATGSGDGSARVFEAATGLETARLDHGGLVTAVAFSPEGGRLATGSNDRSARVFEAATGTQIAQLDHERTVTAVAFSPDGSRVVTGSNDRSARVLDAATGTQMARLDHDDAVYAVAFSPAGIHVATGSGDGTARVFETASGREVSRLDHGPPVAALAFSPDGAQVATGSGDGSARVFEAVTGNEIARFDHDGLVTAVAFSPDGGRVATGSRDRSARVFETATGAQIARLDHDDAVYAVAFSPDGTHVATGSGDGSARVFEAATGTEIARLDHDGTVTAVAFSPDGGRVATASHDHSARVFEAATGTGQAWLDHDDAVNAVAFGPDGAWVAAGSSDRSARVFEAATGRKVSRLDHDDGVNAVAFGSDGAWVATGSDDRSARVFEASTGTQVSCLNHNDAVYAVAFGPGGAWVATGSSDRSARVFEAATGREVSRLDHDDGVNAVAFGPDGAWVATGSNDRSARVFEANTGREVSRLSHDDAVKAVAFGPDGGWVATASWDGSARVFEAATGREVSRLSHDDAVNAVTFSPDGAWVATGSDDRSARVFEAATGSEVSRLYHDGPVNAVAFSPDGAWLATASDDRSARVFEAATGTEVARLDHNDAAYAVAFSPDGARVTTGSNDHSARVFEATPSRLVKRALLLMTRPLNPAELRRYSLSPDCRHVTDWESRQRLRLAAVEPYAPLASKLEPRT